MVNKRDLSLRTPGISGLFALKKPTGGGRKGVARVSQGVAFYRTNHELEHYPTDYHVARDTSRHPRDTLATPPLFRLFLYSNNTNRGFEMFLRHPKSFFERDVKKNKMYNILFKK